MCGTLFSLVIQYFIFHLLIPASLINLARCKHLDSAKSCPPLHSYPFLGHWYDFSNLMVFPTPPKLVSSVAFLRLFFYHLYRLLIKKLNKTRPPPHSEANDKRVGRPENSLFTSLAEERCSVEPQNSTSSMPRLAHVTINTLLAACQG